MTIWADYDEPHGRVLPFRNDFASPRPPTTLEEARAIIACSPAHAKAVAEGRSRRVEANTGDLSDVSNSTAHATDRGRNAPNSPVSVPPQAIPDSDRDSACWTDPPTSIITVFSDVPWATKRDRLAEATMADITPPLMDSQERAQSDSTNGRMHRLIGGSER